MSTDNNTIPDILKEIYHSGKIKNINGKDIPFHSGISIAESECLSRIINDLKATRTLEVGLAHGSSALAIIGASSKLNNNTLHYAIDPFQYEDWDGAAIAAIKSQGWDSKFEHLNGKTHEVFPDLLKEKIILDFAFIDGWHTFDYTLIDFFFIDKILKPGGIIALHDMYGLAKQKVLRFILTHRKYKIETQYKLKDPNRFRVIKFFLWRLIKHPRLIFSWYHWNYELSSNSGLIVLRKLENFEPDFSFYKTF